MTTASPPRVRRRLVRLGVGLAVATAVAAFAAPAWADPTPAPTPGPPRPSPIGPPPTTRPSPTPPGTPAPTPGPNPADNPAPADNTTSADDPAWYDIGGQIRKALTEFFTWMVKQAMQPILDFLGRTVLATPDVTSNAKVQDVWTTCAVVANTCYALLIVAAGFLITAKETLQTRYGLKELLPRLAVGALASNCSLLIASKAIEATNALTAAIIGQGIDPDKAGAALAQTMSLALVGTSILQALMSIAVLVMAIVVLITFVVRLAALVVLVGMAPIALSCHALPQTEGLAYTWWRAFTGCLAIQLGQALVLLVMLKVILSPAGDTILGFPATSGGLIGLVLELALLGLLIKIPMWMRQFVFGPRHGPGLIGQTVRLIVMAKTLGAVAGVGKAGASTAGRAAGRTAGRGAAGPGASGGLPGGRGPRPVRPSGPPSAPRGSTAPGRTPRPTAPGTAARPAGRAAFSNASTGQTPLPRPAGQPGPASFNPVPPTHNRATPTPRAPAVSARFSHTAAVQQPHPPPTPGQAAAQRPAAPRTPVFSQPPRPTPPPAPAARLTPTRPTPAARPEPTPPAPPAPPRRTVRPSSTKENQP